MEGEHISYLEVKQQQQNCQEQVWRTATLRQV